MGISIVSCYAFFGGWDGEVTRAFYPWPEHLQEVCPSALELLLLGRFSSSEPWFGGFVAVLVFAYFGLSLLSLSCFEFRT
jgi:hypothetical protein